MGKNPCVEREIDIRAKLGSSSGCAGSTPRRRHDTQEGSDKDINNKDEDEKRDKDNHYVDQHIVPPLRLQIDELVAVFRCSPEHLADISPGFTRFCNKI